MKMFKKAIIGISAGFITGLFSTGGGMIVLPALIYFLKLNEKKARGTTIFIILPMVITAAIFYYNDKYFNIVMGIKCFVLFLLYASYNMIF